MTPTELGITLLSQQVWCWGKDILRPEGNWLLKNGFERISPPGDNPQCPSVYRLPFDEDRYILLRGYGVFYADAKLGSVFLPRYEFEPCYTRQTTLDQPPWTRDDLPPLRRPSQSQQSACAALFVDCLNWVAQYEEHLIEQLGTAFRNETLTEWDDGSRVVIPAEHIAPTWRALAKHAAEDSHALVGPSPLAPIKSANTGKRSTRQAKRTSNPKSLALFRRASTKR